MGTAVSWRRNGGKDKAEGLSGDLYVLTSFI